MTIVGLNQAVLVTILQHLYVLPPVTFLREFRLAYETYHTRILFFERYVCRPTLTYSILEYTRILEPCYKVRRNAQYFFFWGGGTKMFFSEEVAQQPPPHPHLGNYGASPRPPVKC